MKKISFLLVIVVVFCLSGCGKKEQDSELTIQQKEIYQLALNVGYDGTFEEWLASIKGEQGIPGKNVELSVSDGYIKWRNTGDSNWYQLVSLEQLVGPKGQDGTNGKEVIFQVANGFIQWQYVGDSSWNNLVELSTLVGPKGEDGTNGTNGKEVIFQVANGFIQWQYVGDSSWNNLVELSTLVGPKGEDGTNGTNGKEVIFQVANGFIQWQYVGDSSWNNLVELSTLVGPKGEDGISIINTEINELGELIIYFSDGTTHNLGKLNKSFTVQFVDFNNYILDVQNVLHGHSAITPNDPSRKGYTFIGWDTEYKNVTRNLIVKAQYQINTYKINFNSNGGTIVDDIYDIPYGSKINLPIPTKKGYNFAGWYLEDTINGMQFTNNSPIEENLVLYARWELQHYSVSFFDESDNAIKVQFVLYGGKADAPIVEKEGYNLVGWDTDFSNVTSDIEVKPIFVPKNDINYAVKYYQQSIDGLSYECVNTVYYNGTNDTVVEAYIINYEGFTFDEDNEMNVLSGKVKVDGSLVLSVYYKRNVLSVSFYNIFNELIETVPVLYGSDVLAPNPPEVDGYSFVSWDKSLNNITKSTNITAQYQPKTYQITLDVNGGEELNDNTIDVLYNAQITGLVKPTRNGYTFIKWVDEENKEYNNNDIYLVAQNLTLTAIWEANNAYYFVEYYLENIDGTYSLFESVKHEGVTGLFVETVLKSYDGYELNQQHPNNKYDGYVLSDNSLKLTLYYQKIKYTVTFVDYDDSVISIIEVKNHESAIAPANPIRTGYTFVGWNNTFDNVTSDLTIKALYTINIYSITFDTNGGYPIPPQEVEYNTLLKLPIPTKDYHDFLGWLLDGELVEEVNIVDNFEVIASWKKTDYTISFITNTDDVIDEIIVQNGTIISSLPTLYKIDFYFEGWKLNDELVELPFTFTSNQNIELVASWIGLSNDIRYEIIDDKVRIISYTGNETNLVLPDTIVGFPIEIVGSEAFANNSTIESLSFGQFITTVESQAFYQMTSLTYLKLPNSAQTFGTQVLYLSNNLRHLIISGEANYQLRYYFGNNINFIPEKLETLEFSEGSTTINLTLSQNYLAKVKQIIIPRSVTSMPKDSFNLASNLQSITLPFVGQSRTSTGTNAYFGYIFGNYSYTGSYNANGYYIPNNLKEVIITDATSIGSSAFYDCSSITSIIIPDSVTSIGNYAFYGCSSLTSIIIPDSVTSIGSLAFSGCSSLTSIIIPDSVTSIGNSAFSFCSSLTSIIIPDSVTSIGDYAFYGCSSLTSIIIPDSVTSIGDYAFYGCSSLTSITIPNSVTSIGNSAFYGCSSLQSITLPFLGQSRTSTGTNAYFGYIFGNYSYTGSYNANGYYIPNNLKEVIITDATSIGNSAFYGCSSLTSITIPDSVKSMGNGAFSGCSSLQSITLPFLGQSRTSTGTNAYFGYIFGSSNYTGSYNANGYYIPNNLKEVIITDATSIGNSAFYGCSSLTSITIPNSVTSIGNSAFYGCSSLQSITLPFLGQSRTSTGTNAYFGYIFGSSNYTGSYNANGYYIPNNLKEVIITDATSIGDSAFRGCSSITSITIPNSVTSIGSSAFYGCSSLTSITIPDSVTSIGDYAFSGCSSLTSITIPNSVTSIEGYAFYGCSSLTSIIIPDSVTSIGDYAFRGCSSLTSIIIPDSVTIIGDYAFRGCSSLTSITIPDGATSIGNEAFYGCSSLTSITIPNSVTSIGSSAFYDCSSITSITIPDSVTSIGDYAFYGCISLTSITIPNNVNNIGENVFSNTSTIVYTSFLRKPENWNAKFISDNNSVIWGFKESVLYDGIIYALSNNGSAYVVGFDSSIGSNVNIFDYINGYEVIEISTRAFMNNDLIEHIFIPNTVFKIGFEVFKNNSLKTVEIEQYSQLDFIGSLSFSGCSSLTSITIPDSVTSIGDYAFSGCSSLTSITIPDSVKSMGNGSFSGCSSLTSIIIPDSVTSIGNEAFYGCSSLTSIIIPDSVTSIENSAFYGCSSLQSITLPFLGQSRTSTGTNAYFGYIFGSSNYTGSYNANGYYIPNNLKEVIITDATSIGSYAFMDCSSITSIIIPDSVTSIGDGAFDGCSSLTSITIPNSVTSIGYYAFWGCSSLQSITLPFLGQSRTSTGTNAYFGYIFGSSNYTGSYNANGYYIPNNLKEVIITDATSIGSSAFRNCSSLTSIIIPDSVTSIGNEAFYGCSSLTSIIIPDSVTSIGNSAFLGCSSLTSITIPDSIKSIGDFAFSDCSSLTSIIIPNSVTSIGRYAFSNCSKLTIYVEALSKPSGWDSTWNSSNRPVVWGYNG